MRPRAGRVGRKSEVGSNPCKKAMDFEAVCGGDEGGCGGLGEQAEDSCATSVARNASIRLIAVAVARTTLGEMSLVTTKEAAQILGVTAVRVRQLIKDGRLVAEKRGRDGGEKLKY